MGITTEYNPDLVLRDILEFGKGARKRQECILENLLTEDVHEFLKNGQRNYWLEVEIPLLETNGNSELSRPVASIIIMESPHFIQEGKVWTKGKYTLTDFPELDDNEQYHVFAHRTCRFGI